MSPDPRTAICRNQSQQEVGKAIDATTKMFAKESTKIDISIYSRLDSWTRLTCDQGLKIPGCRKQASYGRTHVPVRASERRVVRSAVYEPVCLLFPAGCFQHPVT